MTTQQFRDDAQTRYDNATAQRVLKLAADMQRHEEETYSAAQIETLAAELGIAPHTVRRAMDVVTSDTTAKSTTQTKRVVVRRRVVRQNRLKSYIPQTWPGRWIPVIAGIVMAMLMVAFPRGNMGMPLSLTLAVLPFVLPFLAGYSEMDSRRARTAGFLTLFFPFLPIWFGQTNNSNNFFVANFIYFFLVMIAGAVVATAGAELRKWQSRDDLVEYEEVIEEVPTALQTAREKDR